MKTEPIQDYILKNKDNLRIAAAVGEAWPEARAKIVARFIDRLDTRLKKSLKGWKSEPYGCFFVDSYANYAIWKPSWDGHYYVTLQCENYGQKMFYGILRDEKIIGKRKFCSDLLAAIKQHDPSGRSTKYSEVVMEMRSPATDWRKPEVLWRIHTDSRFLDEVVGQLLQIARISEPIIDRLVRKYRK